ncbi:MAG: hypothetical protein VB082_06965 [Christensenella sp.]|nr:hypothetical protein [Christensenella sp.]
MKYAPPSSGAQPKEEKMMDDNKRKRIRTIIVLCAVLAVCIIILLFHLRSCGSQDTLDTNASIGQYEGKTPEEIQTELDKVVEENMFNVSIASVIVFENGEAEGELRIENIAANPYLMGVQIMLSDSNEVVYTSGLIEPGYHIQSAKLSKPVSAGTYDAMALFTAYDPQSEEAMGQAAIQISIVVRS